MIKYKDWKCCLELNTNVHVAIKITKKLFDENPKRRVAKTYKFSNHDIGKFILIFRGDDKKQDDDDYSIIDKNHL